LTIDVDGTVVRTGNTVAWAFRGYNPHFKKDPSYYPLLAHLAQTGHILRLKNRPGNVHDSRGAARFLRELIHELRARFGRSLPLEFRMDAAFFQEEILALLAREGCEYAIKVGFWKWVGLKSLVPCPFHLVDPGTLGPAAARGHGPLIRRTRSVDHLGFARSHRGVGSSAPRRPHRPAPSM
jgi:Transposase DDE domain group 1